MKEYFMILLVAGITGSVASVLSDGSSLGKYVKYISALVCVLIVISPLKSILQSISVPLSKPQEVDFSSEQLYESAINLTEEQISLKIKEKFGIIPKGICIEIDRDEKIVLSVILNDEDLHMKDEIDKFIDSLCK
jgi:hypothetical protein